MNILSIILLQQEIIRSTSDWIILVVIQLILLSLVVLMVYKLCQMVKQKEKKNTVKTTCIVISLMTFVAYFVLANMVWAITSIQLSGG
ncbi:MAG: hypothetical protein GY936_19980 [Ignavibacteriae bacterium]|nr:hypothetical protein [Ignavibacteriota bacterium]